MAREAQVKGCILLWLDHELWFNFVNGVSPGLATIEPLSLQPFFSPVADHASLITPSGYVVKGSLISNAQWPDHGCYRYERTDCLACPLS